jgi:hypothetical protein
MHAGCFGEAGGVSSRGRARGRGSSGRSAAPVRRVDRPEPRGAAGIAPGVCEISSAATDQAAFPEPAHGLGSAQLGGRSDLDIGTAMGVILDEGIPLVWVPRPAIVAELVGAAGADVRDSILLSSRDDIAIDCLTVLGEVTAPELKPLAELAAETVSALRGGHGSSAQALAGNIFDTLLHDAARRGVVFAAPPVGYFKYDKVRKQITPVSDDTAIRRFRPDCVLSAALAALEKYDPSDPPPARFVRHATAHRACPAQYTPVNAIVAVMLVASMLREAHASDW